MLISNGKVLCSIPENIEELADAVSILNESLYGELDKQEFEITDATEAIDTPHVIVPDGVDFNTMQRVLGKDRLELKAINEQNELVENFDIMREIEYHFSPNEMAKIANTMSQAIQRKLELENEKKAVMADYKNKIDELDNEIYQSNSKYQAGKEMRNIKCTRTFEFDNGFVIYKDLNGEPVSTEPLTPKDMQLHIDLGKTITKEKKKKGKQKQLAETNVTDTEADTNGDSDYEGTN